MNGERCFTMNSIGKPKCCGAEFGSGVTSNNMKISLLRSELQSTSGMTGELEPCFLKVERQTQIKRWSWCVLILALTLGTLGEAEAQSVWNGLGGDANWTTGANWGGIAPAAGNAITFGGTTQPVTTNDFAADTNFGQISFSNTTAGQGFTLSGNRIILGGNIVTSTLTGGVASATILDTINLDLVLSGNRTITTAASSTNGNHHLTINGVISETGGSFGFIKNGTAGGILTLSALNTFSGTITLTSGTLSFNTIADTGTASALGTGGTILTGNSGGSTGTLLYTGTGHSTNRQIQIGSGATANSTVGLILQSEGSGPLNFAAPIFNPAFSSSIAAKTFTLTGSSASGNTVAGVIQDNNTVGGGIINLTKTGSGSWIVSGVNTFTGQVRVDNGTLSVNSLANAGTSSAIGAASGAASTVRLGAQGVGAGVLRYTGGATSTDRQFQVGSGSSSINGGAIQNDGTGPIVFTNANFNVTDATVTTASVRQLAFQGSNGGEVQGVISDSVAVATAATSVVKSGTGTWILSGLNVFSGQVRVDQGTLSVNSIADGGTASALGTGAVNSVINLGAGSNSGTLLYTGTDDASSNRQFQIGRSTVNAGSAIIRNDGSGTLRFSNSVFNVSDTTITNVSAARTLTLSGTNTGNNLLSGVISNNVGAGGVVGIVGVTKTGSGFWTLGGLNTFTGQLRVDNGTLSVDSLANEGVVSGIGAASGPSSVIRLGSQGNGTGILRYTGGATSTNRQVQVGAGSNSFNGGTIQNDGTGSLTFTNPNFNVADPAVTTATVRSLTFQGSNGGEVQGVISDNVAAVTSVVNVVKGGSGTWIFNGSNTYSGTTSVNGGVLQVGPMDGGALGGGGLIFSGTGVLQGSGNFTRGFSGNATPGVGQVAGASGGFAARGGALIVNFGGNVATPDSVLLSAANSRLGTNFVFGSSTADSPVIVLNPLSTNGGFVRTFTVNSGVGGDYAELRGVISDSGSITKNGPGLLILSAENTYTNTTLINEGTLQLGHGGTTGSLASSGITNNGTLAFNRSDSGLTVGVVISGSGAVNQVGSGTTVLTATNSYSGLTTINSGTLQMGTGTGGSASGSINQTSGLVNNGVLAFNRSNLTSPTYPISGTGVVNQIGNGITELSGVNSYSGGTNVNAGTLTFLNRNARPANGVVVVAEGATIGLGVGATADFFSSADLDALFAGTLAGMSLSATSNVGIDTTAGSFVYGSNVGVSTLGLTKLGANTLSLSGVNSYSGRTSVRAGILRLENAGAIPGGISATGGSSNLTLGGGILGLTTTSGDFTRGLGSGVDQVRWVTDSVGGFAAFGGDRIVDFGGGGQTVTWSNVGGVFGSGLVLGDASSDSLITVLNPINLNFPANNRVVTVHDGSAGVDAVLAGVISSETTANRGTRLIKNGLGTLALTAENTYVSGSVNAGTTINAGTLQLGNGGTTGSISALAGPGINTDVNILPGATLAFNRSDAGLIVSNTLLGGGGVSQVGSGTTTLAVPNIHTGVTSVTGGNLAISFEESLGAEPAVFSAGQLLLNGGALQTTATFALNDANRGITLGTSGGAFNTNGGTELTVESVVSGPGALTKRGAGTLVMGSVTMHTGGTVVEAGVLRIGITNAIGGNVTISGEGAIDIGAGPFEASTVTFAGSVSPILGGGALSAATGFVMDTGSSFSISNVLGGVGTLTQRGSGTTTLTGTNTFTGGTSLTGGKLSISAEENLGAAPAVFMPDQLSFDGGTLLATASVEIDDANRGITVGVLGGTIETMSGTVLSLVSPVTGPGLLTKTGDGELVLNTASSHTGGTTVADGKLRLGVNQAIGGAVTLSGSGVLAIGTNGLSVTSLTVGSGAALEGSGGIEFSTALNFASTAQATISNVLSGAGGLTKTGGGALTLRAANAYTGGSLVSEGALYLDGGSLAGGTVSVASAATLGGTGTIGGPVVMNAGLGSGLGEQGILNVGGGFRSSLNDLRLESDLMVGTHSILDFYLSATGLTKLDVDGLLTLDPTSRIRINLASGFVPGAGSAFDLLDWGTLSVGGGLDLADLLMPLPDVGPEAWVFDDGVFAGTGVLKVSGVRTGPVITTNVAGGRFLAGSSVTLSVAVSGSIPFAVQWYRGSDTSNPINGATGFSYVIPSIGASDSGTYWVRVSNDVGSVDSQFAEVDVVTVPRIETQPVGGTFNPTPGQSKTFTVVAVGPGPLTYVWKKDGNVIVDAPNAASYTITNIGLADNGDYTVSISNAFTAPTTVTPATTSEVAKLIVRQPFEFVSQPQSLTLPEGNHAEFAVELSNDGPFTYQWEFDPLMGDAPFAPLAGETGATLSRNTLASTVGDYRVVVTNAGGSRTSNVAQLRFGSHLVVIDQQPVSKVVAVGSTLELTVGSSGGKPQRYQWFFEGKPVGDETDSTLRIEDVTGARAGPYYCRISNALSTGSDQKNSATVMVAVVDRRPGRFVVTPPGTVSLSVTAFADRTDPLSYQWYADEGLVGGPIAQPVGGATSRTLRVSGLAAGRKRYFCRVSAGSGSRSLDGGEQVVFVTTGAPELKPEAGWSLPDTIVSQPYSFQVPMVDHPLEAGQPDPLKAPASFKAVGLPPGLAISAAGLITGRATAERRDRTGAVIPYVVTITATNRLGTTAPIVKNLLVNPLAAGLIGAFTGPVDRSVGLNGNLGGVINFKTSKTGSYSGSLTMGSLTYGFKGALDTVISDPTDSSVTVKVSRGSALRPLLVSFNLSAAGFVTGPVSPLTRGTITDGRTVASFDGWRNTWLASAANRTPAQAYSGYYTMAMDIPLPLQGTAANRGIPQGTGYASFTVSPANGTMKVTGKMADGTGFTSSSYVGPTGEVLVFKTLYAAKTLGSVVGQMKIDAGLAGNATDNTLSGALSWWKPAQAGRAYAAGFGPFDLSVLGSVYVPPAVNTPVMGLAANATGDNARLSLVEANSEAALPVMTGSPANTVAVRVDNANKVFPAVASNPRNVTMVIKASTGLVTCKFTLSQLHPFNGTPATIVRAVSGEGMIVRSGVESRAWGFFLLPQLPASFFEAVARTPVLSGQIVFEGSP